MPSSETQFKKGNKSGKGRVKGSKNCLTSKIKAAMEDSVDRLTKEDYWYGLAKTEPAVYAGIVKKYIPSKIEAEITDNSSLADKLKERRKRAATKSGDTGPDN